MNHETIFRGCRLTDGQWCTGDLVVGKDVAYIISGWPIEAEKLGALTGTYSLRVSGQINACDLKTVSQYTGLDDKNGTKIYGDDILHWENLLLINDPDIEDNGNVQVVFEYGSWMLKNLSGSELARWGLWKNIEDQGTENDIAFEVIGNIYKKPELLEAD